MNRFEWLQLLWPGIVSLVQNLMSLIRPKRDSNLPTVESTNVGQE